MYLLRRQWRGCERTRFRVRSSSGLIVVLLSLVAIVHGQVRRPAPGPVSVISANAGGPYTGITGSVVSFDGSLSTAPLGQTLSYAWSFGDGGTGTGLSPAHSYAAPGVYSINLTVKASGGGQKSAATTATISVSAQPLAANAGGPYTGLTGTAVSFDGSKSTAPAGQTLTYAWSFGDGGTGTGVSPAHTYTTAGTFTVSLTVTASGGGTNTATTTATITQAIPLAANAGGPYTGVTGAAVSFDGSKSTAPAGQTLTYAWSFGDGGTGTGVSPSHTYTTAGTFTVGLTVTVSGGGTNTATTTATITQAIPLAANAGGPYTGVTGTAVSFDGSKSTAPAGQTLTYAWSFGDGGTGTGVSPAHTYTTAGTFTVSLTVTASGGGTNTATTTATITQAIPLAANAGGPYTGVTGTAVSFDGSKSTAPAGQTLTYAWSFGDGGTGTGVSPAHTYTTAGTFTVSLTVTASGGGTNTATTTATITQAIPLAANAGGPYTGVTGAAVSFDGSKSTAPAGQTLTYAWSFGDGGTGTGVSPAHTYTTAGTFTVSLTVTASGGGTNTATTTATITQAIPLAANAGGPYTGVTGAAVSFDGSKSTAPAGQTLTYAWSFGDGGTGTGVSPAHTYTTAGTFTVSLTVTASGGGTNTATTTATITQATAGPPTISGFAPNSGPVGTLITVTGTNLAPQSGSTSQVTLSQQGGGFIIAPVSSVTATSLTFVIPAGATTGVVKITEGTQSATSTSALAVTTSSNFTLSVTPGQGTLIQGQSTTLAVTIGSQNAFTGLASLSLSGVPSGVTASFQPSSIAVGQISTLTLSAPASQSSGTSTLSITAAATIDGQAVSQSATASLKVAALSTTFLGRTVVDDAQQEPVAGVTVKFLGTDDKGNPTGCSGQTVSDGAGNFLLTNLAAACVGPQLISYNGMTATAPAGKYAGVNLSYTLVSGQVTASPVLVHLPRIDNAETVQVQQNAPTDQIFYFHTIPGVKVTVYAGTTLALDDGSKPNPFPLVAISIPLDRLPEQMPTSGMLMPFIVAFQPANAVASQPVAVNFPNSLGVAPNSSVMFVTLDPTHGYMVPYGTGTVSNDGTEFVADADPNHPGHAYGLVHFDWHGPATPPTNPNNPTPDCGCGKATAGDPVDIGSGLVTYTVTDVQIGGRRGGLGVNRVYRTQTANVGPFGIGTSHNYGYQLNTFPLQQGQSLVDLVMPDGNQYAMNKAPDGTFTNSTIPILRGAVLSGSIASGAFNLRWVDGTTFGFQLFASLGSRAAYLSSITDLNGNKTIVALNSSQPLQIQQVSDPVGRSLTFTYDSSNRITQILDPIGRKVTYTYNSAGTLASVTNQAGGITSYTYDASNNLATVTDPRGVVVEQNTYNSGFDGRVTQQIQADGGVYKFDYTLLLPLLQVGSAPAGQSGGRALPAAVIAAYAASPVIQTVVTDPLGHQTTYRYDPTGFLQSVTDASGQTRTLTHDPNHFNLISDYTGNGTCSVCGNPAKGDIHYTFDNLGNVLTETDSLGDKVSMAYDTRFNKVSSVTDPLGHTTAIQYDANGNPTTVTDANGHAVQIGYDSFGEATQTTDATGAKTAIAYDSFGNLSTVTDALGNASHYIYDGASRLTQTIDPLGRKSLTSYDALDRATSATDPKGAVTQLTYDPVGSVLAVKDAKGNVTSFTYDSRDRLSTRVSPLGKTQSYQYDADSNLTQFTDRRGQVSKFQFDALNRLSTATFQDSTVTNTYDAAGRLTAVNDSMGGVFSYGYDAAGRLVMQSGPTGTIQYTRDALGRVATEQVVGQKATNYTYDAAGNLAGAANSSLGVSFAYDARNLPTTLTRANGVTSNYTFDPVGRLLGIVHANGVTALNTQSYTYNPDGTRATAANDISQALITQASTSTVDSANELLTNGGTTYTYDANGNRLTETTATTALTYAWDSRNRLSSITDNAGNKTALSYDYLRNLLGVTKIGQTTTRQQFVVDSLTNIVSATDANGLPITILAGRSLDSHYASADPYGNLVYGIGDALGGNVGVASTSGVLSSRLYYEPYGQTTGTPSSAFPFAFSGRIAILGNIYYNRDRYYDSATGRFISEDPSYSSLASNPYAYGSGDPISHTDPTGDFSVPDRVLDFLTGTASSGVDCENGLGAALRDGSIAAIAGKVGAGVAESVFARVVAGVIIEAVLPEAAGALAVFVAYEAIKATVGGGAAAVGDIISQQFSKDPFDYVQTGSAFVSSFASNFTESTTIKAGLGLAYGVGKRLGKNGVSCGCGKE